MEVDPAVRLSLPGVPELEFRPTYAQVVAGAWAIGQQLTASHELAGIKGALCDEAFSSGGAPRMVSRGC